MHSFKYALTVTLKPYMFKKLTAEQQFDKTYNALLKILYQVCNKVTLIAELTKNSNIHYHSIITFTKLNHVKAYNKQLNDLFRLTKEFGYICLKQITDEPGWIEYISKDLCDTHNIVFIRPVVKDDFKIFTSEQLADYGMEW